VNQKLPESITIGGKCYEIAILAVEEHDKHGKPLRLRIIREDEVVDIREESIFITAYIHDENLK